MIVAVTGGRRNERGSVLYPSIHQLQSFWILATHLRMRSLVHGNAIGTDRTVAEYTANRNRGWDTVEILPTHSRLQRLPQPEPFAVEILPYPVDIGIDGPWPTAGHKRNARMLAQSRAGVLIAFPGGAGTANCTETALRMGLQVWQWEGDREGGEFKEIAR